MMQSATFYLKMMGETVEKPESPLACALQELATPDARLAEAVATMFGLVRYLGEADLQAADRAALRRVGYLLERFGSAQGSLLEEMESYAQDLEDPVFFTPSVTHSRSERLQREADELQRKWGVYGNVEPRA